MSQRIRINSVEVVRDEHPMTRRVVCCSQDEWFYPIIHLRAPAGEPVELKRLIAFCRERGHEEVLERLHDKASRGGTVRMDGQLITNDELRAVLAAADPAA